MFKPNDVIRYTVTKPVPGNDSWQCEGIIHHITETGEFYLLAARVPGGPWTYYGEEGGALMSEETSNRRLHPDPDLAWADLIADRLIGRAEKA